jgi:hypothetical protein
MNPDSPLYRADWAANVHLTLIGAVVMSLAMLLFFAVFFTTALSKKVREEALEFPLSEAYHDEPVSIFANLRPWIIVEVFLVIASYAPVLYDVSRGTFESVPGYSPLSPMPETQQTTGALAAPALTAPATTEPKTTPSQR